MPLVAHNSLPTFARLKQEGLRVLDSDSATQQDIRELHIGLLNMMPDAALGATERQFFRLIGQSNSIAQFHLHPFTLDAMERSASAREYVDQYYESFDSIKQKGLDALIITGANVIGPDLTTQSFWTSLIEVADWAHENVTSTLCSCLATHAVLEFRYGQKRYKRKAKRWGVFHHQVIEPRHPLVADINSRFDVPHSRWNSVDRQQFEDAGLKVLVTSDDDSVHLATSPDGFRTVFFQGHPEYDTVSLLKEYKRDVNLFIDGTMEEYSAMPENYFSEQLSAILREYKLRVDESINAGQLAGEFPEALIVDRLANTWQDTASAVVGKWIGLIYQVTSMDRRKPFMQGVDPDNPLALK